MRIALSVLCTTVLSAAVGCDSDSGSSAPSAREGKNASTSDPCALLPRPEGDELAYGARVPTNGDRCCEGLIERLTSSRYPTGQVEVIGCLLSARSFQPAPNRVVDLVVPASERPVRISATLTSPDVLYQMDAEVQGVALQDRGSLEDQDRAVFHWNLSVLDSVQEREATKIHGSDIVMAAFEENRPFLKTSGLVYLPMHANPPTKTENGSHTIAPTPASEEHAEVILVLRAIGGRIPRVTGTWVSLTDQETTIDADLAGTLGNGEVTWTTVKLPYGSGTWMLSLSSEISKVEEFQRLFVEAPEESFARPVSISDLTAPAQPDAPR